MQKILFLKFLNIMVKNFNKLPNDWLIKSKFDRNQQRIICDYMSGMTDRYASKLYKYIYD